MSNVYLNVELNDLDFYASMDGEITDLGTTLGQALADQSPNMVPVMLIAVAQYLYERSVIGDVELSSIKEAAQEDIAQALEDVYDAIS